MSNVQIDGVITINGVSPAMISQNAASIASNKASIAALPCGAHGHLSEPS